MTTPAQNAADKAAEASKAADAANMPVPINQGDLVKVKTEFLPAGATSEVMRVEEFHYLRLPVFDEVNRTTVARCMRPDPPADPKKPNTGPATFSDPNRYENWPVRQLDFVETPKKAPPPAPAAPK